MTLEIILLILGLFVILGGAELFTNSIEWLGRRLKLSDGAVGSVFAAVGTALPETLIPIIAIGFNVTEATKEIGVGAILGAPFMLGTLALFVTGLTALILALFGRRRATMMIDGSVMRRDLTFFIIVYSVAILAALVNNRAFKLYVALCLVLAYLFYVYKTLTTGEFTGEGSIKSLFISSRSSLPRFRMIFLQMFLALGAIVGGAELFVHSLEKVAHTIGLSPFIMSVILTPIATELPEKFNSIIWVSKKKDTLALGNITGAMVFQSSIIPAIGITMTPWVLKSDGFNCALAVLLSASVILGILLLQRRLRAYHLMLGGVFYAVFLYSVL